MVHHHKRGPRPAVHRIAKVETLNARPRQVMESSLAQQSIPTEVLRPVSCDRVAMMHSIAPARAIGPSQKLLDALASPIDTVAVTPDTIIAPPGPVLGPTGPGEVTPEGPGGPGVDQPNGPVDFPGGDFPSGPSTPIFGGGTGGGGGGGGAIPEPDTWALLMAGFGLVGGTLRRRRKRDLARG